jgi:hypothetical protein
MEKAADTEAIASASMNAASLKGVMERHRGRRGHCDTVRLGNSQCSIRNSRRDRRRYDDLPGVTADKAGLLPRLQPATGPHPVPAPLAA